MASTSVSNDISLSEIEFLAESTILQIIPRFSHPILHFISGDYGPFRPQVPVKVPVWLALNLKKQQKCEILAPSWLKAETLKDVVENETKDPSKFQEFPFHYLETASMLFASAADDIPDLDTVRPLIEDIRNIRSMKTRKGMQAILNDLSVGEIPNQIKMLNMSAMELLSIRPFFLKALDKFYSISKAEVGVTEGSNNRTGGSVQPPSSSSSRGRRFPIPSSSTSERSSSSGSGFSFSNTGSNSVASSSKGRMSSGERNAVPSSSFDEFKHDEMLGDGAPPTNDNDSSTTTSSAAGGKRKIRRFR